MAQLSWIGVRGGGKAATLDRLRLVETGEVDFEGDAYLSCAELPSGWVALVCEKFDFVTPETVALVSTEGEAMGGRAFDVSMFSEAWGYQQGRKTWSIAHNVDVDPQGLAIEGKPPPEFREVRDRLMRDQEAHRGQQVDFIFDAPMELTRAICGFRPDERAAPPNTVFKEVEPLRSGKGAEAQAKARALRDLLTAGVRTTLFSAAESIGFEPVLGRPEFHKFYPSGVTHALVRSRGELSDSLQFFWGLVDGLPRLTIDFFVRKGSEPRYGRSGIASDPPPPPLTLMERFTGRKQDPHEAIAEVMEGGRMLLSEVDTHLKHGSPQPHVRPAQYDDSKRGKSTER